MDYYLARARDALEEAEGRWNVSSSTKELDDFRAEEVARLVSRSVQQWARAYWRLTKNMNLNELRDYDDELAGEVCMLRSVAEQIAFGEH